MTNPLYTLSLDEQAIRTRKINIARFGAGWLRPPGVSKTLQGRAEEQAEREEAEAARLREAAAAEEAEAEAEMMRNAAGGGEEGAPVEEGEGERDLDEDVPDADADAEDETGGPWDSDDEEAEEEGENEEQEDDDEEDGDGHPAALPPPRRRELNPTTPSRPVALPPAYTPTPDRERDRDRTPQRFRVNPFQSSYVGEGDGDYAPGAGTIDGYSSPLGPGRRGMVRHGATEREISPGLIAATNMAQQRERNMLRLQRAPLHTPDARGSVASTPNPMPSVAAATHGANTVIADAEVDAGMGMDMSIDMDDEVPDGSYEHTDTEVEDISSFLGDASADGGAGGGGGLGNMSNRTSRSGRGFSGRSFFAANGGLGASDTADLEGGSRRRTRGSSSGTGGHPAAVGDWMDFGATPGILSTPANGTVPLSSIPSVGTGEAAASRRGLRGRLQGRAREGEN